MSKSNVLVEVYNCWDESYEIISCSEREFRILCNLREKTIDCPYALRLINCKSSTEFKNELKGYIPKKSEPYEQPVKFTEKKSYRKMVKSSDGIPVGEEITICKVCSYDSSKVTIYGKPIPMSEWYDLDIAAYKEVS
jgi:hypothetical protein